VVKEYVSNVQIQLKHSNFCIRDAEAAVEEGEEVVVGGGAGKTIVLASTRLRNITSDWKDITIRCWAYRMRRDMISGLL
jgi:hypothetical protein